MSIQVLNTDSDLSAKTLVTAEGDRTITGNFTFSRSPSAPFTVTVGSANVVNLDANFLQGHLASFFQNASNLNAGTVPLAQIGRVPNFICQGRLTLTTVTPVTSGDVTAATTLYFTPYQGSYISLYDGSTGWDPIKFSELSIAVPATTSQMYDVFIFNNSGTATLELLAWTNDTTRATALVLQDGVYVKTGALTRRYVGSFRTTTVSGQTEDSAVKRYVWNYYNRVKRPLTKTESTASWNYTTNTYRQANGAVGNQVDVVIGVAEATLSLQLYAGAFASTGPNDAAVGVGEDSTSVVSPTSVGGGALIALTALSECPLNATLIKYPAIGRHFYAWLEKSNASASGNVVTWVGTPATATGPNGLTGWVEG